MLEQSKFLVSFDCQNEKFCEELIITYRTEELRPYLIFPRVKLNPNHLHVYHTKRILSELIDQVNDTYGDGGILQFKTMKGIKNYFDSIAIETQELTPSGFKTALLNRETK